MRNKLEVIKEAWDVHYSSDIDEYGWKKSCIGSIGWDINYFDIIKKDDDLYLIRPRALNGIGTNNGWVKIYSEADLPKETDKYWVIYKDDRYKMGQECFYLEAGWDCFLDVSHYQPIVKPKPPIY